MNAEDLKRRTKKFTVSIIQIIDKLPQTRACNIIAGQLGRSGSSVGANYRSACRARSKKDFVFKVGICEEEADECAFWLEVLVEAGLLSQATVEALLKESRELTAIFSASRMTARSGLQRKHPSANRQSTLDN